MTLLFVLWRPGLQRSKPSDLHKSLFPALNYALTKRCKIKPLQVRLIQFIYGVVKIKRINVQSRAKRERGSRNRNPASLSRRGACGLPRSDYEA
jgi:hypothetical protein